MKILITGHKGYIGSNLYKILNNNKNKILILKKNSVKSLKNLSGKIDCIIHCANKYHSKKKNEVFNTNYLYSKKIYNFFNSSNKEKKNFLFINLNTIYIKKNFSSYINEPYVNSKKMFSDYVKNDKKNIKFLDLLIPTVYGKEGNKKDFYYNIKNKLIKNKQIIIKNKNDIRYFLYISNLQTIIVKILKNKNTLKKFTQKNISYDFKCTNYEFAKFLKKKIKSKSKIL
jgi:nucleoside-diphosphate-sugar epimerase